VLRGDLGTDVFAWSLGDQNATLGTANAGGSNAYGINTGIKVSDTGLVTISGGTFTISKSTEGISGGAMVLRGGTLQITASDDGLSISRGTDAMSADDGSTLAIQGGTLVINATGDGIDVNGSATMSGGEVYVYGPTTSANAAIDYNGSFVISGGTLAAAGSSGMAQAPSTSSGQNSLMVNLTSSRTANTVFRVQKSDGTVLLSLTPPKSYQSVVFSSPDLVKGASLAVYTGSTLYQKVTLSTTSSVTTLGSGTR